MNKMKFILGIAITMLGGCIVLVSMISGIFHFAGSLHEDVQTFGIDLRAPQVALKTSIFTMKEGQSFSAWLKYPNRQIENKNFKIAVSLVDENENIIGKFEEDFRFGYFRNSAGKEQYYKIGEHSFPSGFNGYLRYETKGKWVPPFKGKLVLRQRSASSFPIKQIGPFVIGIFVLIVGIGTIAKNSKKQITNQFS